jgi:Cu+-exporting ATPase
MCAVPVFVVGMVLPMVEAGKKVVETRIWRGIFVGDMVGLALTVPVQVWLARRFYENAWRALKHR